MSESFQSQPARPYVWGRLTPLGLVVTAFAAAADQVSKFWVLHALDIVHRAPLRLTSFLDLVIVWNRGISYGLLQQQGPLGQGALLAVKGLAVVLLWIWLARAQLRLTAVALGLIIGGAIGNAVDRFTYGAVADFVLFHITTETWTFNWYVFNLADAAIVAGVAGLLYESLAGGRPQKRPDPAP